MARIPVGATIAHAYRFAFSGFPTLLRHTWLPQAVVLVLMFAMVWPAIGDPVLGTTQILLLLPVCLLILFLAFVQMTAIAQAALGTAHGGWFHFPLGAPVLRLGGAWLLALLVFIAVLLAMSLITGVLGAVLGLINLAGEAGLNMVAQLIALGVFFLDYAVFLFVGIRLASLLTPQAVAEGRISLLRSWRLTDGNFWRLFAIALGTTLPFAAVETGLLLFLAPPPGRQPGESVAQFQAAMQDWQAGLLSAIQTHWPVTAPLFALFAILFYGVFIGAQCFAYQAVTKGGDAV